jgi:hypothetical protein
VGPWSAGCQVFSDYSEWEEFISKAEKEAMNANKFIYALIQLDDIPDEIMKNAMLGIVTYKEIEKDSENEEEVGIEKDDQKKDNTKSIEKLAQFIEEEKEKTNSDEEAVIKKYNKVIKSDADWKKLESIYGANIWDDLDSFLSSGELKSLKFRNTKET